MKVRTAFVSLVCLLGAATAAHASSIVYNGGGPDHVNAYFADSDYAWTAATNDIQPFPLPMVTLTGAEWWGGCAAGASGKRSVVDDPTAGASGACNVTDFVLTIYDGSGSGNPGNVVTSFVVTPTQTLTGDTIAGKIDEYKYTASFAPITLAPGNYLFGLSADLPGGLSWAWETTPAGEPTHYQFNLSDTSEGPTNAWHTPVGNLAFDLLGPEATSTEVPEPATLSLFAIGLGTAALRRRVVR